MNSKKVIVVGAGIGGLSSAYWLTKKGYDVEVLEASHRPGGRMHTQENNGDKFEVGAQFYHSHYHNGIELMKELGLYEKRRKIPGLIKYALKDGSSFLFNKNIPWIKPLGVRGNLKLYWFMLKHVFLKKSDPLNQLLNTHKEWDNIPMSDLWTSDSKHDVALRDYIVKPLSVATNDGWPEHLNMAHFLHCVRIDLFTDFFTLDGGTSSLADALAEKLDIRYESPVQELVLENGRTVGVRLEKDGEVKKADHVIVAVAPPFVSKILPSELNEQAELFDQVMRVPFPVVSFFLNRRYQKNVWAYFGDMSKRLKYAFAVDACGKNSVAVPSGNSIISAYPAHPDSFELEGKTDAELIEIAKKDVETYMPGISECIESASVQNHPHAVSRYPVGSYDLACKIKAKSYGDGVSFVTDFTGGGYMEAAMISARSAVDKLCAQEA
jgi:protoporphyrinogen/coproporphyrinogen III oxidase